MGVEDWFDDIERSKNINKKHNNNIDDDYNDDDDDDDDDDDSLPQKFRQ